MKRASTCLSAVLATLALSACDDIGACTASVEPGLIITVQDSIDGSPQADGAAGVAVDGAFVDSLRPGSYDMNFVLLGFRAADERPGRYTVRVEKPGYLVWEQAGVRVTGGECHVNTVELTARLQAADAQQ